MQVTVRDLMMPPPLTIREQATVAEATRIILERAVNELYVVDENGRLLGTVSDFALLKARMVNSDADESVTRYVSRSVQLLNPNMRLDEVAGFFRESCCPRLPVVENSHVVGQLSRRDILRALVLVEQIALESTTDQDTVPATVRRFESSAGLVPPQPSGLAELRETADSAAKTFDTLTVKQPGLQQHRC